MAGILKHMRRGERGSSLVEFAIVAPVLVLMVLGTVDMADAYNAYIGLSNAAREGARLAGRGNVFGPDQILQVVTQHSPHIDLTLSGSVLLTTVESAELAALHQALTSSEPDYLRVDEFVILEIFYDHTMITGFIGATVPIYTCAVMPVSTPA